MNHATHVTAVALWVVQLAACEGTMASMPPSTDQDAGSVADAGRGSDAGDTTEAPDGGASAPDAAGPESGPTVGPLAGLPREPGPHLASIEALGADEWLELDTPAGDPEHGTARGRSWGGRAFALAPALRGAFFTGEGRHAYVKPDGFGMDDVWFYDIHGNRWIAVYPGTDTNTFNERVAAGELYIDEHGQVAETGGGLVPIHVLIHAWDYLTYDTDRQRFAFLAGAGMGRYYLPGEDAIDEGVTALEAQREERPPVAMSPWYYDPYEGVFTRERAANGRHDVGGFSAFVYAPHVGAFLNAGSKGVQIYDPETNEWALVEDSGPRPPGYDHGVCYDPVRRRIYMGPGDNSGGIYVYDIESRTWAKHDPEGGPAGFRTNDASIFHDAANDVIVVFHYGDATIYVYRPDEDSWSSRAMPEDVVHAVGYPQQHAFHDPELNAYFLYVAGDSADNGRMFVYRYM